MPAGIVFMDEWMGPLNFDPGILDGADPGALDGDAGALDGEDPGAISIAEWFGPLPMVAAPSQLEKSMWSIKFINFMDEWIGPVTKWVPALEAGVFAGLAMDSGVIVIDEWNCPLPMVAEAFQADGFMLFICRVFLTKVITS